ncbi:Arv1-like family-domain-containing protein [Leucosporidium creatinivorum]|uniref:Protein ARV n=1 Tax=Leucosporidium creatinivorum TaxID=106004 RepID=A0A1Y2EXF3_9BASI|nr:Arv1-like family-domain-containing protein [Leucosporidium creatinivorum]
MAQVKPSATPEAPSYACIHCSQPVASLYITYSDPSNTSLLQCPSCGHLLDIYTTLTFPVLLVDLLLFKQRVYRHLLSNRGSGDREERARERYQSMWRVGAVVVGLDAYIRCVSAGPLESAAPFRLFARTLGYCLLETLSLHACIALASAIFLTFTRRPSSKFSRSSLTLLPLTLFYTALPTLFLLTISSLIWPAEYSPTPSTPTTENPSLESLLGPIATSPTLRAGLKKLSWLSREHLKSGVSRVGNASGWANEALLRKGVGGSSAVVGVSALLNTSKRRTVAILLLAWSFHLVVLHVVDPLLI